MPVALDVDWEAVKAHAIVHGVRDAAIAFGLKANSVLARSAREGWLKGAGVAVVAQPLPASMAPQRAIGAIKASDAALSAMARMSTKSRLGLAKFVANGAKHASKLKGAAALEAATQVKAVADVGAKVHPEWAGAGATPTLRLELIAGALGDSQHDPLPIIDVQATVTPGGA